MSVAKAARHYDTVNRIQTVTRDFVTNPAEMEAKADSTDSLPEEGGTPAQEDTTPVQLDVNQMERTLRRFYSSRGHFSGLRPIEAKDLVPFHMHAYREIERLRTDFPVLLSEGNAAPVSLRDAVDRVIESAAGEGDVAELKKRWFLRLEAQIKTLTRERPGAGLESLLSEAIAEIGDGTAAEEEPWRAEAEDEIRSGLPTNASAFPFRPDTPTDILQWCGSIVEDNRRQRFVARTEALVADLSNLLATDDARRSEARSPEHLEAAIGEGYRDEIDFGALSDVLEEAPHAEPIEPERRNRIKKVLKEIEHCRTELKLDVTIGEPGGGWDHLLEGFERLQSDLVRLTRLARELQVADLERAGRYQPDTHDGILAQMGVDDLTDEDLALCPNHTVVVNSSELDSGAYGKLLELMRTRSPLKVLLLVDRLYEDVPSGGIPKIDSALRLSLSVVAQQTAYVLQTTASNQAHLTRGLDAGMRWSGPALFVIYTGSGESMPGIDPYLVAAAALESRAVPHFQYEPADDGLAAAFSISGNPNTDRVWSSGDETDKATPRAFTYAEFLSSDKRFERHFLGLAPEPIPDSVIPLSEFLEQSVDGQVPAILLADKDGNPVQVAVTADVVRATRRIAQYWKLIRELGGVENSFATRAVERERERLEREFEARLEEVQREHDAQLERTTGELAREIVANIAAGMLNMEAFPGLITVPPQRQEVVRPTDIAVDTEEVVPPEVVEEEEEEEALTFDEPFIETTRCTSCNECTNLNPRMFAYNGNKQAYILDAAAGTYRELVKAAEICPVRIIHPGKPLDPTEDGLEELIERAKPFN